MDLLLAFPQLLFAIALVAVFTTSRYGNSLTANLIILVLVIGGFTWPYFGRIIRGQTLSLREKEFVEAARSLGATSPRILFRELLPNLWGPVLVYATLIIPTNILFEAALSYLGVGIPLPNPSWGNMLSDATQNYQIDPEFFIVPGLFIFVTVLAFNLFGDGLRDALDPRSNR
jgi:peptide/nickel transport system permease protein